MRIQYIQLISVFVFVLTTHRSAFALEEPAPKPDWAYTEHRLVENRFDKKFIRELKRAYESGDFKNVIELNVLLFLRKTDDHGMQVTDEAAKTVAIYLTKKKRAFDRAEKRYLVSRGLVASLLYIESRYGKNRGRFQVAGVFTDMLQVDRPDVVNYLQTQGFKRFASTVSPAETAKIAERTKTKVEWALNELKSLQAIYKKRGKIALRLRGSFAGAFGMSQFLPSSYEKWARAYDLKKVPDLNSDEDAIASTAYYLKANGWKKKKPESEMAALLKYNNSEDYARAILKLADLVGGQVNKH